MKILVAEDDFVSRVLLQELLGKYGPIHMAANGSEAVQAVEASLENFDPYELICLDIMMPEMDGHEALKRIREAESRKSVAASNRAKVIMMSALQDKQSVMKAIEGSANGYLVKPIRKTKLIESLQRLGLAV